MVATIAAPGLAWFANHVIRLPPTREAPWPRNAQVKGLQGNTHRESAHRWGASRILAAGSMGLVTASALPLWIRQRRRRPRLGPAHPAGMVDQSLGRRANGLFPALRSVRRVLQSSAGASAPSLSRFQLPTPPIPALKRIPKPVVRTASGLVIGGILGPATFAGGWPFMLLLALIVFCITVEYGNILDSVLEPKLTPALRWMLWTVSTGTVLAAQLGVLTGIFECAAISLMATLLVLQGNTKVPEGGVPIGFAHISSQVFGIFYVGYLPAFWIRLRSLSAPLANQPSQFLVWITNLLRWPLNPTIGACATVSCVMCIIAADSFAYFGGKTWGRRPFVRISPNKTVEGAYCGLIGSIVMGLLCDAAWGSPAGPLVAASMGALIFFASLLGDLTVSAMKREAGLKDAGSLIPGHGGILDRFDSYFFAAPVAYFCWYVFLRASGHPMGQLMGLAY